MQFLQIRSAKENWKADSVTFIITHITLPCTLYCLTRLFKSDGGYIFWRTGKNLLYPNQKENGLLERLGLKMDEVSVESTSYIFQFIYAGSYG